uniref:Protein kinase domain-containing protein n=1 Tax=Fagus sylvatica TaxID=28930 RepID=A0A2N9G2P0_FAGSY
MGNNQLSGRIPVSLATCQQLKKLGLAHTGLNGSIPKQIFELPNLYFLQLANNSLIGSLPEKFGDLRQLEVMDVSGNQLMLNLSFNSLEGEVPKNGVFANISWDSLQGNYRLCAFDHEAAENLRIWDTDHPKEEKEKKQWNFFICSQGFTTKAILLMKSSLLQMGFATKNLIGKGAFGSVYRAVFKCWSSLLALALIIQGAEFKALAMEFMSNGNLDKWLYPEDVECGLTLSLTQRLNIAIDVASALDYLHHDCDPPVVHCDLKPGNNGSSTIGLKGSIGYIAPGTVWAWVERLQPVVMSMVLGYLLLEMIIAKKPTDQHVPGRLLKDNESLARSCSTSYSTDGDSQQHKQQATTTTTLLSELRSVWLKWLRVGLSCAASFIKRSFYYERSLIQVARD